MITHWGNEVWNTIGMSRFEAVLNGGKDFLLSRVTGAVTATPGPSASLWKPGKMRQMLIQLNYMSPLQEFTTRPLVCRPDHNNEVDSTMLAVANPKTTGLNPVVIPIDMHYQPAVLIPRGWLQLQVDGGGGEPLAEEKDSLCAETHLILQWMPVPANA